MLFPYFQFLEAFHRDPKDIDELFEGLSFIIAKNKIEKYYMDKDR